METSSRVVKIPTNIRSELRKATSKTKFVGKTAPALEAMRRGLYQEQSLSREYNPSDKGIGDPANATEREERRDQIFRAMKYLSQRERDVLVLRFIHRMTIKEIASRMHMRRKNVQRVSTEGIKKVRRRIRIEEAHEGIIIR